MNRFLKLFSNFIFLILLFCGKAFAVPAYPYKVYVSAFNGKEVAIYMKGDEHQKFATTEDGYTVICDSIGWWYACIEDNGIIAKSAFRLASIEDETTELKNFKSITPKGLVPNRTSTMLQNRISDAIKMQSKGHVVGERRALVILMQYQDLEFTKTREDFEALFNQLSYNKDGATGSVRDYYRFASQGQLDYISDVYGPYTSQQPMKYYGANTFAGNDANPLALCIEAIKSLPTDIDYSKYDNDGDGLVDNVHIIYAGYGEEAGASGDAIWAHEYPYRIVLKNEVGYSFASYSCSPELKNNRGTSITNIGVVCHELGHALGAMDYYDTNYGTGGEYEGTGKWDIMASGSWNDEGRTPPNFNPYVRSTVFGWNSQVVLGENEDVIMPRMEYNNSNHSVIYRMETGSSGDYFLLENRQQYSFDSAIPGAGLLIYHVHPNIERYNSTNAINATTPQGFYPVCASYSEPNKKKYGNINTAECPFPGSKGVKSFTSETFPAAVAWNGSSANVGISNISMNGLDGTVYFTTSSVIDDSDDSDEPDLPINKNYVYTESFESNAYDRFTIYSLFGNGIWRIFTKGNLILNAGFVPEASDGEKMLILHVGKKSAINESEAVSPIIEVEPGINYTLTFDICGERQSASVPVFNLFIEDEYGEYKVYTTESVTAKWSTVEIPLTFTGAEFRYKLYGKLDNGGIFVDNIRLGKEEPATSIVVPETDITDSTDSFYSVNGIKLSGPKKGVNIVKKNNGGFIKVYVK